jgi:heat shock protein HtpX
MTGLLHAVIRLIALLLIGAGNWLVLTILLGLGFIISEKIFGTMALPEALPYWSAVAVIVIGAISASPIGVWFARLFYPIRQPTRREAAVLSAAFERVQAAYARRYKRRLKAKLYLLDDPMLQAIALGSGTIAVTRGALEVAEDDELVGVLAHEAAHLHHGDSSVRLALIGMTGITTVQGLWVPAWMVIFLVLLVFAGLKGVLFTWVTPLIFVAPLILAAGMWVNVAVIWVVMLMLRFADRSVEYRADRFAGDLGFGPGLVGFLDRLAGMDANSEHRFLVMYLQSHPPTALRIDRLEQLQEIRATA